MQEQLDINKQNVESRHSPSPFTNIDSKWIIDQNVKCKTVIYLDNNKGENLDDLG